jgi:hypothetical protein
MLFRALPVAPGCNKVSENEKTSGNRYNLESWTPPSGGAMEHLSLLSVLVMSWRNGHFGDNRYMCHVQGLEGARRPSDFFHGELFFLSRTRVVGDKYKLKRKKGIHAEDRRFATADTSPESEINSSRMVEEGQMRIIIVAVFIVAVLACTASPWTPVFQPSTAHASGKNVLNIKNSSQQDVVVRVFRTSTHKRVTDIKVPAQKTKGRHVLDGRYYIVVKSIPKSEKESSSRATYAKGDPFQIRPPAGKYSRTTITLQGVANGNYRTVVASERDFEN